MCDRYKHILRPAVRSSMKPSHIVLLSPKRIGSSTSFTLAKPTFVSIFLQSLVICPGKINNICFYKRGEEPSQSLEDVSLMFLLDLINVFLNVAAPPIDSDHWHHENRFSGKALMHNSVHHLVTICQNATDVWNILIRL